MDNVLLFDVVNCNEIDIKNTLESLTYEQSLYFITIALEKSNRSGLFSLIESEIISRSLREIKPNQ